MSNNLSHAAKVEMKRAHKHGRLMGMVKQKMQDFEDNYKDFLINVGQSLVNSILILKLRF